MRYIFTDRKLTRPKQKVSKSMTLWQASVGNFRWLCNLQSFLRLFRFTQASCRSKIGFFDIAEGYYTDAAQFTVIFSVPLNFLPWLVASKRAGNMMRNNSLKKAMGCLAAKAMQDESGLQRWIRKNTGQMRAWMSDLTLHQPEEKHETSFWQQVASDKKDKQEKSFLCAFHCSDS